MTTVRTYLLVSALSMLLLPACDFPADPPLKGPDAPINPPVSDTVKTLLPLSGKEHWVYVVVPHARPVTPPRTAIPRPLDRERETFYYLPYILGAQAPAVAHYAFPPLLRNDVTGLAFYLPNVPDDTLRLSRTPKHSFTLPYPVRKGTSVKFGDYHVLCTHTDTLITVWGTGLYIPTHRYEIQRSNSSYSVMYVIPAVALLRIEYEDMTFHTIAWRL
jgi:hypothetical protein